MPEKKGLLGSLTDLAKTSLDVAKSSAEELVDRTKAVAHDIAAKVGDEEGNARDRAAAAEARARADAKKKEYEGDLKDLDAKAKSTWGEAKVQAGQTFDKAKEQASQTYDKAKDAATKAKADAADAIDRAKDRAQQTAAKDDSKKDI